MLNEQASAFSCNRNFSSMESSPCFDATDSNTPVGDLPEDEQGSFALVVAGEAGQLLRMPTLPPEASSFDRQADVVLTSEGSITATVRERANRQTAAGFRRQFRGL